MTIDETYILEHFGVKGQRWGVRNVDKSETKTSHKVRNTAIVLGSAAAVAAITVGVVYAKKHFNVSIKDVSKPEASVKKFAESIAHEPVGMMHSSRGKNRGYAFLRSGGLKDPEKEFIDAGMEFAKDDSFKRYGKNGEKLAVRFLDPHGRKDRAGRPIGHDVIFPADMAKDIHNIEQAKSVAWPLIKDIFEPFYRSESGTFGPGF